MKTIYKYTNIFILLIISNLALANTNKKGIADEEREVKANYQVSASDLLRLNNKYGEIHIETWDKNEVDVVITIKAWGRSKEAAQNKLNQVEIRHEKSGREITFVTEIEKHKNRGRNEKSGFEINYKIKMPKTLNLELKNKFGEVFLAEHAADLELKIQHGDFNAGKLLSNNQEISVSFGDVEIEALGSGELKLRHGDCTVGSAKKYTINSQHGDFSIGDIENLDLEIQHGSLEIGIVGKLNLEAGFGSIEIEKITKSAVIEVQHGSCDIDKLAKGFSKLDIESSFGSVDIGFEEGLSAEFDVETSFGGFSARKSQVNMKKEIRKMNNGTFSGDIGSGDSSGKIYITTQHGSVDFH